MKALKILYILAVPTALALLVAWEGARIRARGYELQRLNQRLEQAHVRTQKYRAQINKLKSPGRILHLVRKHGLPLLNEPMERPVRWADGDEKEEKDKDGDEGSDGGTACGSAPLLDIRGKRPNISNI